MAMRNPKGRANYEPNRWGAKVGRANIPSKRLSASFAEPKRKARSCACGPKALPIITARRGSSTSARRHVEQNHIADALTFELSKVKTPVIRERMLSHLVNIHEDLAGQGCCRVLELRRCLMQQKPPCGPAWT